MMSVQYLRRGPMFQAHFGRGPQRAQPAQPVSPIIQILQLLPIILLILFTFLSSPGDPVRTASQTCLDRETRSSLGNCLTLLSCFISRQAHLLKQSHSGNKYTQGSCIVLACIYGAWWRRSSAWTMCETTQTS